MSVYIYNSLTRKKEPFIPLQPPRVNIYACGVTAYDDSHIGHARSLYIFDVIRRYLKYRGFKVRFVRNITDIDDKIINRSKELGISWRELVKRYINRYRRDLAALNIARADNEPKATENIKEMVKHIETLVNKGFAYQTDSGVYFNVRNFKDYGKLSGISVENILSGARIEPDETKKDPLDFALWKRSKEGEPWWDSPFGRGRPGWHIECSAMSMKYLKTETLDIHAGGRDLIFPHHENELAQSEALTGRLFARYWVHHGLLTINGQKMAKSAGNFISIKDFIDKYNDADILKLFFLSAHYPHPIDYNEEKIEECKKVKKGFDDVIDKVNNWIKVPGVFSDEDKPKIDGICARFEQSMDDDFNTPASLACLFELIDLTSGFICEDKEEAFRYAKSKLEVFFDIFSLRVKPKKQLPAKMLKKISERERARKNKDFRKADELRQEIRAEFNYFTSDTKASITLTEG